MALSLAGTAASGQESLQINDGESLGMVTAGYFDLRWGQDADEEGTWRLERAEDASFDVPTVVYEGPDHGTFESGLPNGTYHYRLIHDGRTGPVYTVDVRHHSLHRAFLFLGTGALVFLSLLFVLIRAERALGTASVSAASSQEKGEGS